MVEETGAKLVDFCENHKTENQGLNLLIPWTFALHANTRIK
jgi:hypothetical protein